MIKTNGIELAVFEEGEGVPIVLCHGWPELAYSWRDQIPALAKAGFHVIAPDQRGFGRSTVPSDEKLFTMKHLSEDLIGLLDHYGYEKAIFAGHDWGGFIVWHMAIAYPERMAGVIGVNTPFVPREDEDPIEVMRAIFTDKMYIAQFQDREHPEVPFEADVSKFSKTMMRKGGLSKEEFMEITGGKPTFDLYEMLELPVEILPGEEINSPEERQYYVDAFTKSGFRGGINWYRNWSHNWRESAGLPQRVTIPALMITAEDDRVLPPAYAAGMPDSCDDLEMHNILNCGHWTQAEQPEELNRLMTDWMTRRFG
jgi:pimeloyl-ACP methyl ester carboxylesterase